MSRHRSVLVRLLATVAFVMAGLVGTTDAVASPIGAAHTSATRGANPAISWKVDHAAKTITVTVRIAVFVLVHPDRPEAEAVLAAAASRIEADIRSKWKDLMFKCYRFIVDPQVRLARGPSDVGQNEVGILLDTAIYPAGTALYPAGPGSEPVRSAVVWMGDGTAVALSDDDRGYTLPTGPNPPYQSTWALYDRPGLYAHEFGHILGLGDNYHGSDLVPGTPADLMFYPSLVISPETVTKVIRRSGQVDESKITCPFSIDLPDTPIGAPAGIPGTVGGTIGFHAWACDYDPPTSDPTRRTPIAITIDFRSEGHADAGPLGNAGGGGTTRFTSSLPAPPGMVGDASALFSIDLLTGMTIDTPMAFGEGTLHAAGGTTAVFPAGSLFLNNWPTVTPGAPECP